MKQTDEKGNSLTYWGGLEEPKQETLEEAKENAWNNYEYQEGNLYSTAFKSGFELGVEWEKEQCKKDLDAHLDVAEDLWLQVVKQNKKLYSEEELLQILESHKDNLEFDKDRFEHDRWFEQFKKK